MADTHINVFINELDDAAKNALAAVSHVKTSFDTLYSKYGTELKDEEATIVQNAHDIAAKAIADFKATIDSIRAKYEPEVAATLEAATAAVKEDVADQSTDKKAAKK